MTASLVAGVLTNRAYDHSRYVCEGWGIYSYVLKSAGEVMTREQWDIAAGFGSVAALTLMRRHPRGVVSAASVIYESRSCLGRW